MGANIDFSTSALGSGGGGSSSRLIASGSNIDLGAAGIAQIPFIGANTAANTNPTNYLIQRVNNTDTWELPTVEVLTAGGIGDTLNCPNIGASVVQDGLKSVGDLASELVGLLNATYGVMFTNVGGVISATGAVLNSIGNNPNLITSTGGITLDGDQFYAYSIIRQGISPIFNTNVMLNTELMINELQQVNEFVQQSLIIPGSSVFNIQKQVALKSQFLVNIKIFGDPI